MKSILYIADVLNKDYAISQDDARKIYPFLESAITRKEAIQLSFKNIDNCSTIFLRNTLGNLYLKYGTAVESYLQFVDINPEDEILPYQLNRLKERALNAKTYQPIFEQAIDQA